MISTGILGNDSTCYPIILTIWYLDTFAQKKIPHVPLHAYPEILIQIGVHETLIGVYVETAKRSIPRPSANCLKKKKSYLNSHGYYFFSLQNPQHCCKPFMMQESQFDFLLWQLCMWITATVAFCLGFISEQPFGHEVFKPKSSSIVLESTASVSHNPAGQHLLVDMNGVDSDFLSSKEHLLKAMKDTVTATGITFINSKCHSPTEKSISCIAVLSEGHMAFHVWPEDEVISLDLFIADASKSLIPIVDIIKQFFEIGEDVEVFWSLDYRGSTSQRNTHLATDMLSSKISNVKKEILNVKTKKHHVHVYDGLDVDDTISHEQAIQHNLQPDDPRWTTNEIVKLKRSIYVDEKDFQIESPSEGVAEEVSVHPFMTLHPNPRHVAALGYEEVSSLKEILKHKIESVTFFEEDVELVDIVKEYYPQAVSCADLVGRSDMCLDDEVVDWIHEDGIQWFVDHYNGTTTTPLPTNPFDIVFLSEVKTPESAATLAGSLGKIIQGMSEDGVLVLQLMWSPTVLHPKSDVSFFSDTQMILRTLEELEEVEAIFVYDEDFTQEDSIDGVTPSSYLVACKDASFRQHFYTSTPEAVDARISERTVQSTKSDKSVLRYYDGAIQTSLQVPPKAYETIYCRREPMPFECAYRHLDYSKQLFDFDAEDEESSSFLLRFDDLEGKENTTTSHIFATVDIPKGSYIMSNHAAKSLVLSDETKVAIHGTGGALQTKLLKHFGAIGLIQSTTDADQTNVGRWVPSHPDGKRPKYSPVYDRHNLSFNSFMVATKDISRGDELFMLNL